MFLINLMKRQLLVLNDLIKETSQHLNDYDYLPARTLVSRPRPYGQIDYYEQECKGKKKKLYPLGNSNGDKIFAYKKQRFLREKKTVLENDLKAVENFLSAYKDYSTEAIFQSLPLTYQNLPVNTYEDRNVIKRKNDSFDDALSAKTSLYKNLPDEILNDSRFQKLVAWSSENYKRNPMPLPEDPNIARDGTPMRSKGECMWYDNILFESLPVRVDPELEIQGKSGQWHKLYPDFQFLCFNGSTLLVEHFGGWDDEKYAERNKRKIQEYLDCGFVIGDNLIVTSDNANHRTNELMIIEALEKIQKRLFA